VRGLLWQHVSQASCFGLGSSVLQVMDIRDSTAANTILLSYALQQVLVVSQYLVQEQQQLQGQAGLRGLWVAHPYRSHNMGEQGVLLG